MDQRQEKKKIRLLGISLCIGFLLMLVKFAAWYLTGSNAILSDAAESLVNIVAGAFALYSVRLAAKPRDLEHPYGHGKIEFLAAGLEGFLILAAGLAIIGKSIYNLLYPEEIERLPIGIAITVLAGLVNLGLGLTLQRQGQKLSSLTMVADGKHLLSDAVTSAGLIAGLVVMAFTDILWLDSVIAILFALFLLYNGYKLFRRSVSGVMDEANKDLLQKIVEILNDNRRPQWVDVHNLRVIQYGAHLHIDCHVTFPWYWDLQMVHQEIDDIEQLINDAMEAPVEIFIHADPCLPPPQCPLCDKFDCEVRQHPFTGLVPWTLENVLQNKKHGLQNPDNTKLTQE